MTEFQPKPQTPEQVNEGLRDAMKQALKDGVLDATPYLKQMTEYTFPDDYDKWNTCSINLPKQSNWTCYAFGGDASFSPITWTPQEGKVPNAWVRFWMKVFFDCNWVKNK